MENSKNKYRNNQKFDDDIFNDTNPKAHPISTSTSEKFNSWIENHPLEFISIGSIIVMAMGYKLYQRMLTNAIFNANKKTLDYAAKRFCIVKETL